MAKTGYHVLVGARSPEKGEMAVRQLQSRGYPGSGEFIQLDVTKDADIEQAAKSVEKNHGKLDILVNNAGIAALDPPLRTQMRDAFDANATGPAVLVRAFESLLKKSTLPARILNVSSGVGSIAQRLDPNSRSYKIVAVQYRASKAAMNMVTACQHVDYSPLGIKVFAYCPGFTVSNLSDGNTAENGAKVAADAVLPMIDILEGKRDDEAGLFLHNDGVYPW